MRSPGIVDGSPIRILLDYVEGQQSTLTPAESMQKTLAVQKWTCATLGDL